MNDLEQLGHLWSEYLHAKRQATRAVQAFVNREYIEEYTEEDTKYQRPDDIDDRKIEAHYRQDMWDKQQLEDNLYKQLVDATEAYWIKELN